MTKIAISCGNQGIGIDEFVGFKQIGNHKLRKQFLELGLHTKCFELVDYTCQKCNKRGGDLNAHHIESWASNIEKRFDINNLVCLCASCHKTFHKIYSHFATSEDLHLFLE